MFERRPADYYDPPAAVCESMMKSDINVLVASTGMLHCPANFRAMEAGIPFIAIRAVADPVTHGLPPAALLPLDEKGNPNLLAVFGSILKNPGQIPALIGTGNQTRVALRRLSWAGRELSQ